MRVTISRWTLLPMVCVSLFALSLSGCKSGWGFANKGTGNALARKPDPNYIRSPAEGANPNPVTTASVGSANRQNSYPRTSYGLDSNTSQNSYSNVNIGKGSRTYPPGPSGNDSGVRSQNGFYREDGPDYAGENSRYDRNNTGSSNTYPLSADRRGDLTYGNQVRSGSDIYSQTPNNRYPDASSSTRAPYDQSLPPRESYNNNSSNSYQQDQFRQPSGDYPSNQFNSGNNSLDNSYKGGSNSYPPAGNSAYGAYGDVAKPPSQYENAGIPPAGASRQKAPYRPGSTVNGSLLPNTQGSVQPAGYRNGDNTSGSFDRPKPSSRYDSSYPDIQGGSTSPTQSYGSSYNGY